MQLLLIGLLVWFVLDLYMNITPLANSQALSWIMVVKLIADAIIVLACIFGLTGTGR